MKTPSGRSGPTLPSNAILLFGSNAVNRVLVSLSLPKAF
jgi:hypothetical protein